MQWCPYNPAHAKPLDAKFMSKKSKYMEGGRKVRGWREGKELAPHSYTVCIRIAPACSVAQSVELIT